MVDFLNTYCEYVYSWFAPASTPSQLNTSESECQKPFDPILLPDAVVDIILEYLDDNSLLAGRLVSQRWEAEITNRIPLWRRRCERSVAHVDTDMTSPPTDTYFFRLYVYATHVLRKMSHGKSWTPDHECKGSGCDFHDYYYKTSFDSLCKRVIARVRQGELVVINKDTNEVMWRTGKDDTDVVGDLGDRIFSVTLSGNIETYTWDGRCEATDIDGKLRDVAGMSIRPDNRFILILLKDKQMFLVDDKMQVFSVDVSSLQLPEQQPSEDPSEAEPIDEADLMIELGDGRMAMLLERQSSMTFAIISERGQILHHKSIGYGKTVFKTSWSGGRAKRFLLKIVSINGGHISEHAIQLAPDGIAVQQLWKKALHFKFAICSLEILIAGKKFLVAREDTALQVYQLDDGAIVARFPSFFIDPDNTDYNLRERKTFITEKVGKWLYAGIIFTEGCRYQGRCRRESLYFLGNKWLDGLSPTTVQPDIPVALWFSSMSPWGSCLRWSKGL